MDHENHLPLINRHKNEKKSLELLLRNIQQTSFLTLILDYLRIKNFLQKSGSVTFLHLWYLTIMQNLRKILGAVFEKNHNGRTDRRLHERTNTGNYYVPRQVNPGKKYFTKNNDEKNIFLHKMHHYRV